jgi:hypothetical protein
MAPVYFYIEHRFPRRTFNTLIKLIMITVYPLSRSPYISLLDCLHPIHCLKTVGSISRNGNRTHRVGVCDISSARSRLTFFPTTTTMHSPAPNNPGAASAPSPFTDYMNELKATSEDDIRAGDETLDAIFDGDETLGAFFARSCEDHALGVGGGAASAGRTAAPASLADVDESGAASAPPTLPSAP